jgi:acyl-CoA carboxylase epsilon subunit
VSGPPEAVPAASAPTASAPTASAPTASTATASAPTASAPTASAPTAAARPTLRVVSGDASPEEIAAVVAAVSSGLVAAPDADRRAQDRGGTTSTWTSSARTIRQVRATFTPGRHAWRTSFWPR